MSMSAEHAEQFKNDPAVVCCRTEEGTIISAANLEDPAIFPDMVDSGLLTIPDDCYKIGEVLGAKLLKTIDSLTPITPAILEGAKEIVCEEKCDKETEEVEEVIEETEDAEEVEQAVIDVENSTVTVTNGVLRIKIEEGKGIDIELPF